MNPAGNIFVRTLIKYSFYMLWRKRLVNAKAPGPKKKDTL